MKKNKKMKKTKNEKKQKMKKTKNEIIFFLFLE